mmetsp:Transcript_25591/g.56635  ORF Transcript_25591/g.56635 Transcript_25591/m.56635 type:complete len:232 (+) Transcript_25591:2570-3265(+)
MKHLLVLGQQVVQRGLPYVLVTHEHCLDLGHADPVLQEAVAELLQHLVLGAVGEQAGGVHQGGEHGHGRVLRRKVENSAGPIEEVEVRHDYHSVLLDLRVIQRDDELVQTAGGLPLERVSRDGVEELLGLECLYLVEEEVRLHPYVPARDLRDNICVFLLPGHFAEDHSPLEVHLASEDRLLAVQDDLLGSLGRRFVLQGLFLLSCLLGEQPAQRFRHVCVCVCVCVCVSE